MRYLLICALVLVLALLSYLFAGRRLITLLDQFTLTLAEHRPVGQIICEAGTLELGNTRLDLTNPAFARLAELSPDARGRAVLESNGRRFPLGAAQPLPPDGGPPRLFITKDSGDRVVLTLEQSRLAWPTPFEMNFMTGYSASRKRNVYLRLRWTKLNGGDLEMLWKTEQGYYARDGWLPPRIEAVISGLVYINMRLPSHGR